jgi:hypothetical protein
MTTDEETQAAPFDPDAFMAKVTESVKSTVDGAVEELKRVVQPTSHEKPPEGTQDTAGELRAGFDRISNRLDQLVTELKPAPPSEEPPAEPPAGPPPGEVKAPPKSDPVLTNPQTPQVARERRGWRKVL